MSITPTPRSPLRYLWFGAAGLLLTVLAAAGALAYQALRPVYDPPAIPAGEFRLDEERAAANLLALLQEDTTNPPLREDTLALARERILNRIEREYVQPLGLESKRKDPAYVATLRASGTTRDAVVLVSYLDLPPMSPEGWRCDLRGERRGETLCGAGALRGKAQVITYLEALAALKRSNTPLPFHVSLVILWDAQGAPDTAIKGLLSSGGLLSDLKLRAVIENSIAGEYPDEILPVGVAERRGLWVRLYSEGSPLATAPDGAVDHLVSGLGHLADWDKGGARLLPVVAELARRMGDASGLPGAIVYKNPSVLGPLLLRELDQTPATRAQLRASIETTALSAASDAAGGRPDLAEARAAVRLLPDEDPNAFLGELRRVLEQDRLELEVLSLDPPAVETAFGSTFFQAVEGAARHVTPGKIVAPVIAPERSVASPFAFAGVPVLRLPLPAPQRGPQEELSLSQLRDSIELVYQVLYAAAVIQGDPFVDLVARR